MKVCNCYVLSQRHKHRIYEMSSSVDAIKKDLLQVSTGYGLMNFTWRQEPVPLETAFATLNKVVDLSLPNKAFFNVGEFYGPNFINLEYVNSYFSKFPEKRSKVIISCKGGLNNENITPQGDRLHVSESIENCVRELGCGPLDIFQVARIDTELAKQNGEEHFPRESFDTIVEYIERGVVGGISLSEVTEAQIRAIHKEYAKYLCCVEVELSLFSTDILHNGVAEACNELGLPIICYSPLGRGLLTGQIQKTEDIPEGDFRKALKRFNGDSMKQNLVLVQFLQDLLSQRSDSEKITTPQLALAWIRSFNKKYNNTKLIPIPGGTTVDKVVNNMSEFELSDSELNQINDFLKNFKTQGDRYEQAV